MTRRLCHHCHVTLGPLKFGGNIQILLIKTSLLKIFFLKPNARLESDGVI